MNKFEFMRRLENELMALSTEERADILMDYEEHFRIGIENGKAEEQIARELGDPKELAKTYLEEVAENRSGKAGEFEKPLDYKIARNGSDFFTSVAGKILAGIGLFFLFVMVLIPVFSALIGVLAGISAIPVSLFGAGIAVIAAAFWESLGVISVGLIFVGAALLLLGFSSAVLVIWMWKWLIKGFVWLFRRLTSVFRGKGWSM